MTTPFIVNPTAAANSALSAEATSASTAINAALGGAAATLVAALTGSSGLVASLAALATATGMLSGAVPPTGSSPPIVIVSVSQTISDAGLYIVDTTGITLTLGSVSSITGPVIINDYTGALNPNITISGPINGSTSLLITLPYGSVTLIPSSMLNAWVIM